MAGILQQKKLNQIFGIEEAQTALVDMKNQLEDIQEEMQDVEGSDDILRRNLERAEKLLDLVQSDIENGNVNDKLINAAGLLINAITSIANSLVSASLGNIDLEMKKENLELKKSAFDLKKDEFEMKKAGMSQQTPVGNTTIHNQSNVIVSSREELLKMIAEKREAIDVTPS